MPDCLLHILKVGGGVVMEGMHYLPQFLQVNSYKYIALKLVKTASLEILT